MHSRTADICTAEHVHMLHELNVDSKRCNWTGSLPGVSPYALSAGPEESGLGYGLSSWKYPVAPVYRPVPARKVITLHVQILQQHRCRESRAVKLQKTTSCDGQQRS